MYSHVNPYMYDMYYSIFFHFSSIMQYHAANEAIQVSILRFENFFCRHTLKLCIFCALQDLRYEVLDEWRANGFDAVVCPGFAYPAPTTKEVDQILSKAFLNSISFKYS